MTEINNKFLGLTYLKTPRIGSPLHIATLLFMSNTAPAPSLTWLEFPEEEPPHDQVDQNKLKTNKKKKAHKMHTSSGGPIFLKQGL